MAADKITIEVEAQFIDKLTAGINKAKKSAASLDGKKFKSKFDADTNPFMSKFDKILKKTDKLTGTTLKTKLDAMDKASQKIDKVFNLGKSFGKSVFTGTLKIIDAATSPIRGIYNALFNLKTLFASVVAAFATQKLVIEPINLADAYSNAQIGFSTLLGDTAGQQMMDKIDDFAKTTPFKTSGVISNVQKMMAYGWDVNRVIEDMETIGDAAAATGRGDQGLESIVYALSEIRSKGKLSTQELNQLASAGIKAKAYLAEGLGYGTSDEGMKKLAAALEDGAIGANQAIDLILEGMKEFDGMMDRMGTQTVEGLKSTLEDTFEINVARKWGQGLQEGAKRGLGAVVELLDDADYALSEFGDLVYEVGSNISGWFADRFENAIDRAVEIMDSFEFSEASLPEKIGMLFKGVITDPLKEWWETDGRDLAAEKAADFGSWLGKGITEGVEMLSNGILYMLGLTPEKASGEGKGIGASFWDAFTDSFDAGRITDAISSAISGVWAKLPTWAKFLLGGYAAGKAMGGIASFASGVMSFGGGLMSMIGSTGAAGIGASGVLGKLANIGYGLDTLLGGTAALSASGASAAFVGGGTVAGGILTGYGLYDTFKQYKKAFEAGNIGEKYSEGDVALAKAWTQTVGMGFGALGGAKAGAAIGTAFGPLGTLAGGLLGAGIGWAGGKLLGNYYEKQARAAEAAKFASEELQETYKNEEATAEELAASWDKAVWERQRQIFGDIELSAGEIATLSKQIVLGDKVAAMDEFASATSQAEASMQNLQSAVTALDRWNWKAGLGIAMTTEDQKGYKQAIDDYINSAQNYLESQHYEFTAGVNLLMDTDEGTMGSQIIKNNDAFYANLKEQVAGYSDQLSSLMSSALENGRLDDMIDITIDGENFHVNEQDAIEMLQEKISNIVNSINAAEEQAQLDLIEVKFKNSGISYDSYEELQSSIDTYIETALGNLDEAQLSVLTNLRLRLNQETTEEGKAAIQKEIDAVLESYGISVEQLEANVNDFVLKLAADNFSADAMAQINTLLSQALKEGIKPGELTAADITRILGLENFDAEAATVLAGLLNNLSGFDLGDYEFTVTPKVTAGPVNTEGLEEGVTGQVEGKTFGPVNATVDVNPTVNKENIFFGVSDLLTLNTFGPINAGSVNANVGVTPNVDTVLFGTTVNEIVNGQNVGAVTADTDVTMSPAVDTVAYKSAVLNSLPSNVGSTTASVFVTLIPTFGKQANGGLFGFANGGIVGEFKEGGYTRKKMLSWIGEEGPEAIIPLTPARRGRALDLWEETGERLGVLRNANGGVYGDSVVTPGGGSVQVDVGGITISVKAEGGNVLEAIKAQREEIAEEVAEVLNVALSAQFMNMPVRG